MKKFLIVFGLFFFFVGCEETPDFNESMIESKTIWQDNILSNIPEYSWPEKGRVTSKVIFSEPKNSIMNKTFSTHLFDLSQEPKKIERTRQYDFESQNYISEKFDKPLNVKENQKLHLRRIGDQRYVMIDTYDVSGFPEEISHPASKQITEKTGQWYMGDTEDFNKAMELKLPVALYEEGVTTEEWNLEYSIFDIHTLVERLFSQNTFWVLKEELPSEENFMVYDVQFDNSQDFQNSVQKILYIINLLPTESFGNEPDFINEKRNKIAVYKEKLQKMQMSGTLKINKTNPEYFLFEGKVLNFPFLEEINLNLKAQWTEDEKYIEFSDDTEIKFDAVFNLLDQGQRFEFEIEKGEWLLKGYKTDSELEITLALSQGLVIPMMSLELDKKGKGYEGKFIFPAPGEVNSTFMNYSTIIIDQLVLEPNRIFELSAWKEGENQTNWYLFQDIQKLEKVEINPPDDFQPMSRFLEDLKAPNTDES